MLLNYVRAKGKRLSPEDVVQDSVIKAYKNIHTIKDEKSFPGWMIRIVANCIYDHIRMQDCRPSVVSDGDDVHDRFLSIDELGYTAVDTSLVLGDVMDMIKPDDAELLYRIVGGQSIDEISESLNLPTGTIKSRTHRMRRSASEAYREMCAR